MVANGGTVTAAVSGVAPCADTPSGRIWRAAASLGVIQHQRSGAPHTAPSRNPLRAKLQGRAATSAGARGRAVVQAHRQASQNTPERAHLPLPDPHTPTHSTKG